MTTIPHPITANPFTDYTLPPISGGGSRTRNDHSIVTTLAIGEESGTGPVVPEPWPPDGIISALTQVFHGSPQFRAIRWETRDLRVHPLLGGISGTRWNAWNAFTIANAELVTQLADRPALPLLRQVVATSDTPIGPLPSLKRRIDTVIGPAARLPASGILSGDDRGNRLSGSTEQDVLLGWGGNDRLIGRGGGDILSGGDGADRFLFSLTANSGAGEQNPDTITDFRGSSGDRLVIRDMTSYRGVEPYSGVAGEVRFSPGLIEADLDGDGRTDWQINLPGVSELRPQWLIAAVA